MLQGVWQNCLPIPVEKYTGELEKKQVIFVKTFLAGYFVLVLPKQNSKKMSKYVWDSDYSGRICPI